MSSTLLNSVVKANIYAINSNHLIDRNLYPYGAQMIFGSGNIFLSPVTSDGTVNSLEAIRVKGAALVYTGIRSLGTGENVYWTDKTIAQILTDLAS